MLNIPNSHTCVCSNAVILKYDLLQINTSISCKTMLFRKFTYTVRWNQYSPLQRINVGLISLAYLPWWYHIRKHTKSMWKQKKSFVTFCNDADTSIHSANCAGNFCSDMSNLAWISSSFSSVTLCLQCVLLFSKTECSSKLPAWNWCIRKYFVWIYNNTSCSKRITVGIIPNLFALQKYKD